MVVLTDEQAEAVVETLREWATWAEGLSYPDWMQLETEIALETIQAGADR